jgi:hypothetical protein
VPQPIFESYTPTELALRRQTVESTSWITELNKKVPVPVQRHELDTFFISYINNKFPLPRVDVENFTEFVMEQKKKKYTQSPLGLWWYSHPSGQTNFAYPSMDHQLPPSQFDMFRRRR